jgi:methionine-rich copper-binding protein CopC
MKFLRNSLWVSFLCIAPCAFPQAALVSSVPFSDTKVAGPTVEMHLKFDRHVDAAKSEIKLAGPDSSTTPKVTPLPQSAPENLDYIGRNLTRGEYQIQWHAVDESGKDSDGIIIFRVK